MTDVLQSIAIILLGLAFLGHLWTEIQKQRRS